MEGQLWERQQLGTDAAWEGVWWGGQPASLRFPLDQGPQMGVRLRVRKEDSRLGVLLGPPLP